MYVLFVVFALTSELMSAQQLLRIVRIFSNSIIGKLGKFVNRDLKAYLECYDQHVYSANISINWKFVKQYINLLLIVTTQSLVCS